MRICALRPVASALALALCWPRGASADPVDAKKPPVRIAIGLRGDLVRELAPTSVWGMHLFGDLAFHTSRAWLVPRLGVSTGYMTTLQTVVGEQRIFIRWSTLAAEGSPLALRAGPVEAFPLVRVVGGYANASTPDFFGKFLYVRPFLTTGIAARVRVALGRTVFVEAGCGADFDVVRSRFAREDGSELFASGPVVWNITLGAGVRVVK